MTSQKCKTSDIDIVLIILCLPLVTLSHEDIWQKFRCAIDYDEERLYGDITDHFQLKIIPLYDKIENITGELVFFKMKWKRIKAKSD